MLPQYLLLAVLAHLSYAQDSTVVLTSSPQATTSFSAPSGSPTLSLFIPGADSQALVASIVSVKDTTTTMNIGCPPGTPAESCGFPSGLGYTLTGTNALDAFLTAEVYTASVHCNFEITKSATCTGSYVLPADVSSGLTSGVTTDTIPPAEITANAVIVTAGGEKLASNSASTTSTKSSSSGTRTGSGSAASTQTGAAGRIGVQAVGLGVAAVVAAAL